MLVGLGTGMIGGGMLVPLGAVFNDEVLAAGSAGFSSILVAMGLGVGGGVMLLTLVQAAANRLAQNRELETPKGLFSRSARLVISVLYATARRIAASKFGQRDSLFVLSVFLAGGSLFFAASMSTTLLVYAGVLMLGLAAGSVYVTGLTLLHENVEEVLRGRVFAAMYTLVRFCLLISMAAGGFLSDGFQWFFEVAFDNEISIGDWVLALPGVRGALWLGALLILMAGVLAALSLRARRGTGRRAPQAAGSGENGP